MATYATPRSPDCLNPISKSSGPKAKCPPATTKLVTLITKAPHAPRASPGGSFSRPGPVYTLSSRAVAGEQEGSAGRPAQRHPRPSPRQLPHPSVPPPCPPRLRGERGDPPGLRTPPPAAPPPGRRSPAPRRWRRRLRGCGP